MRLLMNVGLDVDNFSKKIFDFGRPERVSKKRSLRNAPALPLTNIVYLEMSSDSESDSDYGIEFLKRDNKKLLTELNLAKKELEALKKVKYDHLPKFEDYDDDREKYADAIIEIMMSGDLSEYELKHCFTELVEAVDDEWAWVVDSLWKYPKGKLWRICNGKLEFNRNELINQSEWINIWDLCDDALIPKLGYFFNKLSNELEC